MRLGIDFGTTRTVVAACDRGNYPVIGFQDGRGDAVEWFPSVVAARGGELRFGLDALDAGEGGTTLRSFKRLLHAATPETPVTIGDTTVTLAELLSGYLGALRRALVERSNLPRRPSADEPLDAVVAVPANARGAQRFLTLDAFRDAGFAVHAILNEPSAAGFEYTHRHRNTLSSRREHVVVYDLGGGTFDASLVRMTGAQHDVLATAGIGRLGGDDFDAVLADLVQGGRPASPALLERCREAKESLNPSSRRIVIDGDAGEVTIAVADYYAACAPLIDRTLEAMTPVLEESGDGLAGIYVVGGASALPAVGRALRDRFGRRAHRSPYPFAAVAIGLAIAADEGSPLCLSDRFSRCFGVFREADGGRDISFDPIFDARAPLPAAGDERPALERVYRAAHNVGYFRFIECSAVTADGAPDGDITPSGEIVFAFDEALRGHEGSDVKVERRGGGPLVRERYEIDPGGVVRVTITDLESGYARAVALGSMLGG
jgi:molecular chaperone DnaK (HSP70)